MKSRSTSGPRAEWQTKLRVVAAVCTMTTRATMQRERREFAADRRSEPMAR